jgi:lipoate-protein ligase B
VIVRRLGRVPYDRGLRLQEEARERVLSGEEDELLVLDHEPVVTLGRRGGLVDRDALSRLSTPVVPTDRGGLATWHGPGQVVVYPVVDLRRAGFDVTSFVKRLGEAMAGTARALGAAEARYDEACPGVYGRGGKLGSIGLHVHRGVTTHGIAFNVDCDLAGFRAIVPCGLTGIGVTTLVLETGKPIGFGDAAEALVSRLLEGIGHA